MEETIEKTDGRETYERGEIHSLSVRAGKRTYFFDVKATKRNDYYLTITESKKRFGKDGKHFFEKHKIFLYREDFEKFVEGLQDSIEFIKSANPVIIPMAQDEETEEINELETVEFDDLGK
jgi:hypothetical protein